MELRYGAPEKAGLSPARIRHVEQLVKGWAEQGRSQGYAFVIARRGIIASFGAYGQAGPEPDAPPLALDTIFPLSSLSKPMACTAAMILVERGLISLGFPVAYYIPEFVGVGKNNVQVRHLMTHTSGLRDEDVRAHSEQKKDQEVPPAESTQDPMTHQHLYLGYDTPLWKPPGKEMSYCSYGVELLGEIVRRVCGQTLGAFCRENLFNPVQMNDTHFVVPESKYSRVIRRAEELPGGRWYNTPEAYSRISASGGAYSTALDMAKFGQMFLNKGTYAGKRVLGIPSVYEMTRNQIPHISSVYGNEYFVEASYGYNWSVNGNKRDNSDLLSPDAFNHGGAGGVTLAIDPRYELVTALFAVVGTNNDGNSIWFPERFLFNNAAVSAVED